MRTWPLLVGALLLLGCTPGSQLPHQTGSTGLCSDFVGDRGDYEWLSGQYSVTQVAEAHQLRSMQRVKLGEAAEVDSRAANELTGHIGLPEVAYYYLVRVAYIGDVPSETVRTSLVLSVDVDAEGVAYVSTYVLSRSRSETEIAAILASSAPVKRVVALCNAAE